MAPAGIDGGADNPGLARRLEMVAHVRPPPRHLAPDERVAIRANRLGVRRDVEAGVVAAHLVMIDVGLWQPLAIHQAPEMLRLRKVQREAVAIVVVPGVFLVEPGQVRRFVFGADILHVPVGDHLRPIRIDGRHDDADHVVEDLRGFGFGASDAVVDELSRRLRRRNLARVEGKGLDDHRLAFRGQLASFGFAQSSWVSQPRVDLLVVIELAEIGR